MTYKVFSDQVPDSQLVSHLLLSCMFCGLANNSLEFLKCAQMTPLSSLTDDSSFPLQVPLFSQKLILTKPLQPNPHLHSLNALLHPFKKELHTLL